MIVTCEACGSSFKIDETKLKGKAGKFTCKKCGHVQVIHAAASTGSERNTAIKQAISEASAPEPAPATAPPQEQAAPAGEQTVEWFIAFNQERMGPWTLDQVREWLFNSKPIGAVLVWKNGFPSWKSIRDVDIFSPMLAELEERRQKRAEIIKQAATQAVQGTGEETRQRMKSAVDLATLIQANAPVAAAPTTGKEREKIDIDSLMKHEVKADVAPEPLRPKILTSPPLLPNIKEYKPPEKKKIHWMPIVFLPGIAIFLFALVLVLGFYKVVTVPGLDKLPVIGKYYEEKKLTYEELYEKYVKMVQFNEAKVLMQQEKEEQLKEAERMKRVEEEKRLAEERKQRLMARMEQARKAHGGGTAASSSVMEFNFDEESDDLATTGDAFGGGNDNHMPPLSEGQISAGVKKYMKDIVQCVEQSREVYNEKPTGEVVVGWTISFRGTVRNVRLITGQYRGSFLDDCLVERISRWRFPRSGGNVSVSYPFTIN